MKKNQDILMFLLKKVEKNDKINFNACIIK